MTVYTVDIFTGYDHQETLGIFSTREKAEDYVNTFTDQEQEDIYIDEYVVDSEVGE